MSKNIETKIYCGFNDLSAQPIDEICLFSVIRGTQRQFLENICSEDDFRSRIFGTFVVKFLSPASPRIFEQLTNGIIAHF